MKLVLGSGRICTSGSHQPETEPRREADGIADGNGNGEIKRSDQEESFPNVSCAIDSTCDVHSTGNSRIDGPAGYVLWAVRVVWSVGRGGFVNATRPDGGRRDFRKEDVRLELAHALFPNWCISEFDKSRRFRSPFTSNWNGSNRNTVSPSSPYPNRRRAIPPVG